MGIARSGDLLEKKVQMQVLPGRHIGVEIRIPGLIKVREESVKSERGKKS